MSPGNADRNLLLGILAYQNAFITKDQLLAGMQAWLYDKARPLAEILGDQGALDEPRRALLGALVDQHVKQHGGDPQQSLQAVSSAGSVRRDLARLADPDLQASIGHLPAAKAGDPYATTAPSAGATTTSGTRFLILRPHAKGGLGEVHVALDTELNREVALKEIQDKHADDKESRVRFLLEAEITGGLEHPSIVPVYGLGTYADGRPFYAMRFIRGDSLQDAIKRYHRGEPGALATGERTLELRKLLGRLIDVCDALQYAHDRGVLHRDIKPGNIMLGKYGETLVVDWGLAKASGAPGASAMGQKTSAAGDETPLRPASAHGSAETLAGSAIGTPAYMSPEQAEGRLDILGPATDVYSLGATLYALLTGAAPAEGALAEVLHKVRSGDLMPPRRRDPTIDAALEAVCLRAMALRPGDRYGSPRHLADDLEHWLAGEPVTAYREPLTERARRWARKHKPLVSAAAALVAAAVPLLTILFLLSENDRVGLETEQGKTKEALVAAKKLAAANKLLAEEADKRREQAETLALRLEFEHYFAKAEERPHQALVGMASLLPTAARLKDQAMAESLRLHVAVWCARAARLHALCAHQDQVVAMALSADGKTALTGSVDGTAWLWETATGQPIGPPLQHQGEVHAVALSADGQTALTGSHDKTAQVWATATGKPIGPPLQHQGWVRAVALSADGKTALTRSDAKTGLPGSDDCQARLWETATGTPIGPPLPHQGRVEAAALSADGKTALTGSSNHTARLWEAATGKPIGPPLQHQGQVVAVALSADGKTALTGSLDKTAQRWDGATGKPIGAPLQHLDQVRAVALSTDGTTALTRSGSTAHLWATATGTPIGTPLQHLDYVAAVALSADGKTALTGSSDKTARLWETATGTPIGPPLQHQGWVAAVALSADGKTALTGGNDETARLWETGIGKAFGPPLLHQGHELVAALSADGKTALTGGSDRTARLWETRTGKQIGPPLQHQARVVAVALSANGKLALTGSGDRTAHLWDTATGKQIGPPLPHQQFVSAVALSADGKTALTASHDQRAQLWETATGTPIGPPLQHQGALAAMALSGDGKTAITGSGDRTARLWDTATGKSIGPPLQHQDWVRAVALSADGVTALTGSDDKTARLWQAATGKPIGLPLPHQASVRAVALSADGATALTGSEDKTARLWQTATGKPTGPLQHQGSVVAVALSADGKTALTGSRDKTARLWETATGKPIGPPLQHQNEVDAVALSAAGTTAMTGSNGKTARLWNVPQPLRGDPERIMLWVQMITGLEVDERTAVRVLDAATWHQRRQRLQELGGPPSVD